MFNVKGKKVLVVGLGVSGLEAAKLLKRYEASVKVSDSGTNNSAKKNLMELSKLNIETEIGVHSRGLLEGVDLVVVSPGVPADSALIVNARNKGLTVISELELGYRFCPAPIIAITGTNGKSTTTELIGNILRTAGLDAIVCGNIGNPISGEIGRIRPDSLVVVEVSSFQLETVENFCPYISVLLNVADDHYDRHGNFENYKKEKIKIFKNQEKKDWAVINSSFKNHAFMKKLRSNILYYGNGDDKVFVEDNKIMVNWDDERSEVMDISDIPLEGEHNLLNVECAILVSKILKICNFDIEKGIKQFAALGHRFEHVGVFNGVEFIDDSKATNIDATCFALRSVDKPVVLIAGGIDKGGDYSSILPLIKKTVKHIVVIGEAKKKIKDVFSRIVGVTEAKDMKDAVELSVERGCKGDIVMLSPMCSSFDMFSGYKERGKVFQKEVFNLVKS